MDIDVTILVGLIGSVASIGGLLIGLVQTIRLRKFKKEVKTNVWSEISSIKAIMEDLEYKKSEVAHARVSDLFRAKLRSAILLESKLTIKEISLWRKTGKLSSRWQEKLALCLLETNDLNHTDAENVDPAFSNWDAFPPDHEFSNDKPTIDKETYNKVFKFKEDTVSE